MIEFNENQMKETCKELSIELSERYGYFAIDGRPISDEDIEEMFADKSQNL